VFDNEHSLHLWKWHPCTSTVERQLTDWREQVTWRDLRGLFYSHSDIVCLLIHSNCIELQPSINIFRWVAWLFDHPVTRLRREEKCTRLKQCRFFHTRHRLVFMSPRVLYNFLHCGLSAVARSSEPRSWQHHLGFVLGFHYTSQTHSTRIILCQHFQKLLANSLSENTDLLAFTLFCFQANYSK
jgi:hypothetical protein